MDHSLLIFAACGAAGAVTYSFPVYIKAASKIPPIPFAAVNCFFSVFVGALCATVFTRIIGHNFAWTVNPEPWPLAMVVGLGSNPLVPIFLRRLANWAEGFEGKST